MSDTVWTSAEERERTIEAVKRAPKRPNETVMGFLERIAKSASLIQTEEQLALREPGEEG